MSDQPKTAATSPTAPSPQPASSDRQMQALIRAPVTKLYANGIGINSTSNDITLVFLEHGAPSGIVSMSYTTAKSVMDEISNAIKQYENNTGEKVKSINEISAISAARQKK